MIFWILIFILIPSGTVQDLRFDQCRSGWVQVEEGTKDVILLTCTTSSQSFDIYWSISGTDQQSRRRLSTCFSNQVCSIASSIEYKLTRPDKSYSNLELLVPADRSFLVGRSFICSHFVSGATEVVCNIDLVYPPSAVIISRQISNTFPYLEGDTVNLVCDVQSSPGNPVAELTWSGYRGNPVVSKSIPTTLQLTLQREDNNRNITCKATNKYTENKGLDIQTFTILEVYYRPVIVLKHGNDDSCEDASDSWKCTVTEGQQVDVECTADSNPPPANISWRLAGKHDLPVGSGSRLNIRSANFIADSVVYICSVITEKMNSSDIRLPLSSERYFIVTIIELQNREGEALGTGASVGVTIAVFTLIVAVTGIVLFVWARRRGLILPCAGKEERGIPHQETAVQLSPSEEQNRGIYDNKSYTEDNEVNCGHNYAMLKVEEIGLTAPYSDLRHYENISGTTDVLNSVSVTIS